MFLNAKAFFDNNIPGITNLLIRSKTEIPAEFVRRYKKNVVKLTPYKTGALRRSIITQQLGDTANISWRSRYAGPQNAGFHTIDKKRVVNIDGNFVTLKPGIQRYVKYTTGGTGPHFANIAYQQTQAEMPAALRQIGLIK